MTTTPEGRREPLSAEERDDLRVLALRATQGPWKADGTIYEHMVSEIRSIMPGEERGIAQVWQHPQGFADARFIAAANPATVLSLLAALEEAEGRERRLREVALEVLRSKFSTYRARNGRDVGIQDESGEKCWIVPFDPMFALEAVLAGPSCTHPSTHELRSADNTPAEVCSLCGEEIRAALSEEA